MASKQSPSDTGKVLAAKATKRSEEADRTSNQPCSGIEVRQASQQPGALAPQQQPATTDQSLISSSPAQGPIGASRDLTSREEIVAVKSVDGQLATQLRSTLVVGQLIASNRPSAGSHLIASELSQMSQTVKAESVALRKEIYCLPGSIATALKSVLVEERNQRNQSSLRSRGRRPVFGRISFRRVPIHSRRPQRPTPMQSQKSIQMAARAPVQSSNLPSPMAAANNQGPASPRGRQQQGQPRATTKSSTGGQAGAQAAKTTSSDRFQNLMSAIKSNWPPEGQSSEGEADDESTDSPP